MAVEARETKEGPPNKKGKTESGNWNAMNDSVPAVGPGDKKLVPAVKHVLSKELQLYYQRITELLLAVRAYPPPESLTIMIVNGLAEIVEGCCSWCRARLKGIGRFSRQHSTV